MCPYERRRQLEVDVPGNAPSGWPSVACAQKIDGSTYQEEIVTDQASTPAATRLTDEERLSALEKYFPRLGLRAELTIFSFMDKMCEAYKGGFWEYFKLSNGGFFMAPRMPQDKLTIQWDGNDYEGEMSPEAAGICATMMAISHLSFAVPTGSEIGETLAQRAADLWEFINEHPEGASIFAMLD